MSIVVALRPELEAWVEETAVRDGVAPGEVAARAIEAQWEIGAIPLSLSGDEFNRRIREDFSAEFWARYRLLYDKISDESFTEAERQEFLELHREVEAKNLERMTLLAQFALLRGLSLPDVMRRLGVGPVQMPVSAGR